MDPDPACPTAEELQRFVLGQVSKLEMEAVERHLPECPHCLETLRALPHADALVETLRSQAAVLDPAEDSPVQAMIRRMEVLRLPLPDPAAQKTPGPDGGRQPGAETL